MFIRFREWRPRGHRTHIVVLFFEDAKFQAFGGKKRWLAENPTCGAQASAVGAPNRDIAFALRCLSLPVTLLKAGRELALAPSW